jgi:flagellar biosynthesis protein
MSPASPPKPPKGRAVAIALSHEVTSGATPTVVAKGYGELAEKILRLAFENDVKVRSDPDLAQILSVVEVDCEIPVEAFAAVAEILTYVYRLNGSLQPAPEDAKSTEMKNAWAPAHREEQGSA